MNQPISPNRKQALQIADFLKDENILSAESYSEVKSKINSVFDFQLLALLRPYGYMADIYGWWFWINPNDATEWELWGNIYPNDLEKHKKKFLDFRQSTMLR